MFIGHFGVGFGAKRLAPRVSLGTLFLAAQFLDLLCRRVRNAVIVGALVVSHWLLDLLMHQPDLPILPGDSLRVGFGAWNSLPLTLLIEIPVFLAGVWFYARCTAPANQRGKWGLWSLVVFLLAIHAANLFGSPPPNVAAIAWAGQLQWLFVLWAWWVDKHRSTVTAAGQ